MAPLINKHSILAQDFLLAPAGLFERASARPPSRRAASAGSGRSLTHSQALQR